MLCFYAAFAQTAALKISGRIRDAKNNPVTQITVYLLRSADSSLIKFSVPDKNGGFEFGGLSAESYLIVVTGIGYKKLTTGPYQIKGTGSTVIGNLQVVSGVNALKEVEIVAEKQFIENKPGKKILNVQYSVVAIGSNALEILKQAAGVKVNGDNTISLNGKNNVLVLIDNRPTYMQPDALVDMLQGMQSSSIDQIELISNPGANYDADSAGGVINIKLKKNKNYGTNGTLTGTIGARQLTDDYGSRLWASSGITFNNRTKNMNVFGNYSYSYIPYNRILVTDRFVSFNNKVTEIKENYFSDQTKNLNAYRLGADYYLTPKQIIAFFVNGSTSNFILHKNTQTGIYNSGFSDSTITTTSRLDSKASQIAVDLNYKGSINKASDLSVDMDYFSFDRTPLENISSNYFYSATQQLYRTLNIQNTFPSNYKVYTFNSNYDLVLSPTANLTATAKMVFVKANNNLDFGEIVNAVYHPDPNFTDHFDFTETISAGALVYNKIFSKKLTMEVGLRVEQTTSDGTSAKSTTAGDNNYFDIFPDFKFTQTANIDNVLQLSYSRHIFRPFYTDLNPFVAYQDQYSYYMGNGYLKPVYVNAVELEHIYKNKLSTKLQFSVYNNFIQTIFSQNDTTKIIINKKANLGNRYLFGIVVNDQVRLNSWWSANINLSVLYNQFTATPSQGYLNLGSQEISLKIDQSFNLPTGVKAEFNGDYETPSSYGIFKYKSLYYFNGAISKSINKQLNVALNIQDIFNTNSLRISSDYQNLNFSGIDRTDFRRILFTVSCKFGSKTIKGQRLRQTGAETEQNRVVPQ
jgi:iron complex outermembrane receptor protein